MWVSENGGTPKSSILIGISIINHPFWGTPIFGNTHIYIYTYIHQFSFPKTVVFYYKAVELTIPRNYIIISNWTLDSTEVTDVHHFSGDVTDFLVSRGDKNMRG